MEERHNHLEEKCKKEVLQEEEHGNSLDETEMQQTLQVEVE